MIDIRNGFELEFIKFPAGESQAKVKRHPGGWYKEPEIICRWESPEDTERLILVKDALDNIGYGKFATLYIPYMPYSRQDRITEEGASFALRCFANILNSLNFKTVTTLDAHSNATELLVNNLVNIGQTEWLSKILDENPEIDCIIAPDAGAYKKVYSTCAGLSEKQRSRLRIVCAQKHRDLKTGEISSMEINPRRIADATCLVLDDICDGGRTFVELAKCADTSKEMYLAVTHGIFSNGMVELEKRYLKIFVMNNMSKIKKESK